VPSRASVREWHGAYQARWRDLDGRWRSKSFSVKREAERFANRVTNDLDAGVSMEPTRGIQTVGQVADRWLANQHDRLRPRVWANYERAIRLHVKPTFGARKITTVTPGDVLDWVAERKAAGVSATTVALAHNLLGRVYAFAIRQRLVRVSPVIVDEEAPRRPQDRRERFLTEEEVERLAEVIDGRYRCWLYTAAYSGLRFGELAALTVADVFPARRTVSVRASLQDDSGRVTVGPTKTDAGNRTVVVATFVADMLGDQIAGKAPAEFVFSSPEGGPLRKENVRKRVWLPAVAAAGLENVRIHDLRHTHATWLADARVPWPEIARTLGHTNPSFTMNRYAHAVPEQSETSADLLGDRRAKAVRRPAGKIIAMR